MLVPNSHSSDPSMRYEGLARAAFNCIRHEDPFGIADANFFDFNFVPEPNEQAINALKHIVGALIDRASGSIEKELMEISSSLKIKMNQDKTIELIDYLIKICQEEIE